VEDALRAAVRSYAQVTFSDAGHGFFCDQRPSDDPDAARQSWALTLAFLESDLRARQRGLPALGVARRRSNFQKRPITLL
jgi:hypothetical protein